MDNTSRAPREHDSQVAREHAGARWWNLVAIAFTAIQTFVIGCTPDSSTATQSPSSLTAVEAQGGSLRHGDVPRELSGRARADFIRQVQRNASSDFHFAQTAPSDPWLAKMLPIGIEARADGATGAVRVSSLQFSQGWDDLTSWAKGGKQLVRQTDLIGKTNEEIQALLDAAKAAGLAQEVKRPIREQKGRRLRNKRKRTSILPFNPFDEEGEAQDEVCE